MPKKHKEPESIVIVSSHEGRIDKFLTEKYTTLSRSYFQRLINHRDIMVDGHAVTSSHKLKAGQTINIKWPGAEFRVPQVAGTPLPFKVVFEDDFFMVINKPAGLLCHPAGWKRDGSTLTEILFPLLRSEDWPDDIRPGLVHRLDRDTSGLLVFAKTPEAHAKISKQFANRQVKKMYTALVEGNLDVKEGSFECAIGRHPAKRQRFAVTDGGRWSVTKFKVKENYNKKASLVELFPLTGRTHQLRVHLSAYKHPILGDNVYGNQDPEFPEIKRQMLHASYLQFSHPDSLEKVEFKAVLPDDFQDAIKLIRSNP